MSGWISIGIDNVLIDVIIEYNSNNRPKSCVLSCVVGSMRRLITILDKSTHLGRGHYLRQGMEDAES